MPRLFTIIFIILAIADFTLAGGGRRSLHQPYLPQSSSLTPAPSPEPHLPKQQPKHPFSTSTPNNAQNDNPFFPSDSSPPLQPSSFPVTIPANISSLSVPHPPASRKPFSGKLLAVILCLSLLSLLLIVVLFYVIHDRNRRDLLDICRAENFNLTLTTSRKTSGDDSSTSTYQKLSSPEIRPLPPLPRRNLSQTSRSSKRSSASEENDEEVFFSPRVSSPSRPSSNADSPDRKPENPVPGVSPPPPPPPPPPLKLVDLTSSSSSNRKSRKPVNVYGVQSFQSVQASSPLITPAEKTTNYESSDKGGIPKTKLKPLHWDKVRASSDRSMVWDQIKSSSFQLNEEMIETLFVANSTPGDKIKRTIPQIPAQENRVLDPKKSQNIAILLRALNVTFDEVCDSLLEGNADGLGTELLESLMKMAPTKEEERKLKEYKDESPTKLGNAERFLKAVVDIPFAFKRVDAMLYITNFDSELDYLHKSFGTLELACSELKNNRMFLKLLEAVLKTGNRMNVGTNRGDARAFKLDTLLKLVDVKGADGKTTLLHFVVQEIIRSEGSRLSGSIDDSSTLQSDVEFKRLGLQVVAGLSGELSNVKKAAAMDSDVLSNDVLKLAEGIEKVRDVVNLNEKIVPITGNSVKFAESMNEFLARVEEELENIQLQKDAALRLVRELTEYFHGDSAREEAHRLRIFTVVRDFLSILDVVCKDVGKINDRTMVNSGRPVSQQMNPSVSLVFPVFNLRRAESPEDDEGSNA